MRERIAAECSALWDELAIRRGRSDPYSEGYLDGIDAAIRVVTP